MKLSPGWIAAIVYGLVCVAAAGWLCHRWLETPARPAEMTLVATRSLPEFTLLDGTDLEAGADGDGAVGGSAAVEQARKLLVGRYLKDAVAKGQKVGLAQTSASPALIPPAGMILIGIPLADRAAAQALKAGTPALLCSGDKAIGAASYTVAATRCDGAQCMGYVEVSSRAVENGALFQPGLPPRLEPLSCQPHAAAAAPPDHKPDD